MGTVVFNLISKIVKSIIRKETSSSSFTISLTEKEDDRKTLMENTDI